MDLPETSLVVQASCRPGLTCRLVARTTNCSEAPTHNQIHPCSPCFDKTRFWLVSPHRYPVTSLLDVRPRRELTEDPKRWTVFYDWSCDLRVEETRRLDGGFHLAPRQLVTHRGATRQLATKRDPPLL